MKFVLLIFAMFSLAFAPAMAAGTCVTDMNMEVSSQEADTVATPADMDCCAMSDQETGYMPDYCATMCALGCAGYFSSITPPIDDGYQAALVLHLLPDNARLASKPVSFEPPPPRI